MLGRNTVDASSVVPLPECHFRILCYTLFDSYYCFLKKHLLDYLFIYLFLLVFFFFLFKFFLYSYFFFFYFIYIFFMCVCFVNLFILPAYMK